MAVTPATFAEAYRRQARLSACGEWDACLRLCELFCEALHHRQRCGARHAAFLFFGSGLGHRFRSGDGSFRLHGGLLQGAA